MQQTVRNLVGELGDVPLIGFAGAPFTVASYLVEGGPSRTTASPRHSCSARPELWSRLLDRLAGIAIAAQAQVQAGASAVQLFDSWAGTLSPAMYQRHVMPASAKVLAGVADLGVPTIHFGVPPASCCRSWPSGGVGGGGRLAVPLDAPGPARAGRGGAGQPRPGGVPGALAGGRGLGVGGAGGQRRAPRPHLQPGARGAARDRPAVLERLVDVVHEGGAPVTTGLVVMAYGTPASPHEIEGYYTHIRRGRPPSAEQLAELTGRYQAIGGVSPLAERTRRPGRGAVRRAGRGLVVSNWATSTRRPSSRTRWRPWWAPGQATAPTG